MVLYKALRVGFVCEYSLIFQQETLKILLLWKPTRAVRFLRNFTMI